MARAARLTRLENRTARLKLEADKRHRVNVGKGMILIYRRGPQGGTWAAKLDVAGRYTLKTLGEADDYRDADGKRVLTYFQAQERLRALWSELHAPKPAATVAVAVERYLAWFHQHRKSAANTEATIQAHILPTWGDQRLCDLTAPAIRTWLDRIAAQPARRRSGFGRPLRQGAVPVTDDEKRARKATANRVLAVFKAILNKAFHDELVVDDSPWRKVKPFAKVEVPRVRFLTADESRRLVNACAPECRALVRAALLSGCRYGELSRLTGADFNPDTRVLHIRESKSGHPRYIPLSAEGVEFFRTQALGKASTAPLLTNVHGQAWAKSQYQRDLVAACAGARIEPPVRFHELRHTYASLLAQAGADLLTISKLLGHSDTRITSLHYAHLCDRTLARAVEAHLPDFSPRPDDGGDAPASNVVTLSR